MLLKILIGLSLAVLCESQLIVQTQYGPIRGAQLRSGLDKVYYSFQRIPFMQPPVGRLRFRDAEIPNNWTEPLDCTQQGPRFPQVDFTFEPTNASFSGDLDSMHINVYTNNLNPQQKYPVMVFIHGGGFRTGSGLTDIYGPDYFVERNVILVTFNYRLYAFGFLSLDDPELNIPGNAGFKDQVLALKWIKDNIENFGGDSNNITIFGQSSGGGCSHYHILSPLSKDLFQRSIIMSGSAFNPMYGAIPRRNWAYRLAKQLNDSISENEKEILEFLEQAEPEAIFNGVNAIMTPYERNVERLLNAFGPVIEPYDNGNAFMLSHPEILAENSWGNDVDIMIGGTSFENAQLVNLFLQLPFMVEANSNFTSFVPYQLDHLSISERQHFGDRLKEMYYGMMNPSPTNFDPTIILTNDFAFWHIIDRVVMQRINSRGTGQTFVYRFDINDANNCFRARQRVDSRWHGHLRAIHMDDLCYLFKPSFVDTSLLAEHSLDLIDHMTSLFTTFGSTGRPVMGSWNSSISLETTLFGYNIRENLTLATFNELPEMSRMKVWREMYRSNSYFLSINVILLLISVIFSILN